MDTFITDISTEVFPRILQISSMCSNSFSARSHAVLLVFLSICVQEAFAVSWNEICKGCCSTILEEEYFEGSPEKWNNSSQWDVRQCNRGCDKRNGPDLDIIEHEYLSWKCGRQWAAQKLCQSSFINPVLCWRKNGKPRLTMRTEKPTTAPATSRPTYNPTTSAPTLYPTSVPTYNPTSSEPTLNPATLNPTQNPTSSEPTTYPTTLSPTEFPSLLPTKTPTTAPTVFPTPAPTGFPTPSPTDFPTPVPTGEPTHEPTQHPNTPMPTGNPTTHVPTSTETVGYQANKERSSAKATVISIPVALVAVCGILLTLVTLRRYKRKENDLGTNDYSVSFYNGGGGGGGGGNFPRVYFDPSHDHDSKVNAPYNGNPGSGYNGNSGSGYYAKPGSGYKPKIYFNPPQSITRDIYSPEEPYYPWGIYNTGSNQHIGQNYHDSSEQHNARDMSYENSSPRVQYDVTMPPPMKNSYAYPLPPRKPSAGISADERPNIDADQLYAKRSLYHKRLGINEDFDENNGNVLSHFYREKYTNEENVDI